MIDIKTNQLIIARLHYITLCVIGLTLFISCVQDRGPILEISPESAIFSKVDIEDAGIDFENTLSVNDTMNFFKYGYYYMGGGVSSGDLNGDGLVDLFFTGNMVANSVYLNKGDMQFVDITEESGLMSEGLWHTGCLFHDFNADGKMDIYVSVSGIWADRSNLLYINTGNDDNGIPTFEESAESYGLNDSGYSIQACPIDYDNDGDLDLYVVNYNPTEFNTKVLEYKALSDAVSLDSSDRLYRNNGDGTFSDVTIEAGVLRFGLGIGVVASDINQDGLTDIYVSNDFQTPDFFYVNNGDGTFTESLQESFQHTAFYGMGVDVADMNNDLLPDLYQVDMTTTDNYRSKANMSSMNIPAFWAGVEAGFGYQYMYNSLQLNNGLNPDGNPYFSDVAMANQMHATDWSWACLLADYDQDGLRDVFISNGTRREINNKDYFKWLNQIDTKLKVKYNELNFADLTAELPEVPTDNYMFKNEGSTFTKVNSDWGISYTGYSNGATYADLDNDGDLEIILNNIDSDVVIFENKSSEVDKSYLQIALNGSESNPLGLGAKLYLRAGDQQWYHEHTMVRGYQSSVDSRLHFGLDTLDLIDEVEVVWPDGQRQILNEINTNQLVTLNYVDADQRQVATPEASQLLSLSASPIIKHSHIENIYDDYEREVLIPHKMSSLGPKFAVADINGDAIDDVFVPGPSGQKSTLYFSRNGKYKPVNISEENQEDVAGDFMDVDGDGVLDLVVTSGGNEIDDLTDVYYTQRYYTNVEYLQWSQAELVNPDLRISAGLSLGQDIDGDGVEELFVFGRQVPGRYPSSPKSYVFSKGEDVTNKIAAELSEIGMVTAAVWTDYDGDGDDDLILTGEWMGIEIFSNYDGQLIRKTTDLQSQVGWWKSIEVADYDGDGDEDFIIGNLGTNYKYQASDSSTFDIYSKDFDQDSDQDIVLTFYQEGNQYPVRGRQCSSEQMPTLKSKFPNYHSFASSTVQQIYGAEELGDGIHYKANNFRHIYVENKGNGRLEITPLPAIFQRYSINAMDTKDIDGDGNLDVVMVGNIYDSEVETPRSDAGYGIVAMGNGDGTFEFLPNQLSGLYIPYEAQDVKWINTGSETQLLVGSNNAPVQMYQINR